jgi:hypothetical protein
MVEFNISWRCLFTFMWNTWWLKKFIYFIIRTPQDRVLKKLMVFQLFEKFSAVYGTFSQNPVTDLYLGQLISVTHSHYISFKVYVNLFPSTPRSSLRPLPFHRSYQDHLIYLELNTLPILCKECKEWSSSSWPFLQKYLTSPLCSPNSLLSACS